MFPKFDDGMLIFQNPYGTHFGESCFAGRCYMTPPICNIPTSSLEINISRGAVKRMSGPHQFRAGLAGLSHLLEIWCYILKQDGEEELLPLKNNFLTLKVKTLRLQK